MFQQFWHCLCWQRACIGTYQNFIILITLSYCIHLIPIYGLCNVREVSDICRCHRVYDRVIFLLHWCNHFNTVYLPHSLISVFKQKPVVTWRDVPSGIVDIGQINGVWHKSFIPLLYSLFSPPVVYWSILYHSVLYRSLSVHLNWSSTCQHILVIHHKGSFFWTFS